MMYQSRLLVNISLVAGKSLQAMESKIEKLNNKVEQFKAKTTTKNKVIFRFKNQNIELNNKIMKIKGEHDQDIQNENIESDALKIERKKLKAQVDKEVNKMITAIEVKLAFAKSTYDNMNNNNIIMHQIIKDL